MVELWTVERVATRLGITPRTLHYYEEVGLLTDVGRTEGGHRVYSEETIERLERILRLKETLGYPLKEIRKILEAEEALGVLREAYHKDDVDAARREELLLQFEEVLGGIVERIDERIAGLQTMRNNYDARLTKTRALLDELRGGKR